MCISRLFNKINQSGLNSIKNKLTEGTGKSIWNLSTFFKKPQSQLEINRAKMQEKIAAAKRDGVIELDSSKLDEAVREARKHCSPGGFGQG